MSEADRERYRRASELFARVCDLEDVARAALLDRECTDAPEVRRVVERMLAFDERPRHSLENSARTGAPGGALAPLPDRVRRYRIDGSLGRGGMGVVLEGRDGQLDRTVAVKLLHEGDGADPERRRRFEEEARIGGSLQHPGIVPVHEFGEDEAGRPYFTMRRIQGRTLAALLAERGADPAGDRRRFLSIFERVAEAVAYAHSRSIVHRDLKPGNVMVGEFGEVLVVDWGLARRLDRDVEEPGRQIAGTPAYMAPEQARGEVAEIDRRTDVFALGAMLCEILTGRPPYGGERSRTLVQAERAELEVAAARLDACGADPEIVALALECVREDRSARPADAGEVARAVTRYLASVEERAQQARIEGAEAQVRAREERRARRLTLALAFAVLAAVTIGAFVRAGIEREEAERRRRSEASIASAVGEARLRRERARAADPDDLSGWVGAVAAARRAESHLADVPLDPAREREVRDLLASLRAEEAGARRDRARREEDRAFEERLEAIPISPDDDLGEVGFDARDAARRVSEYEAAFRAAGIDVLAGDERTAAARVRERTVADAIAAALDQWALASRTVEPTGATWPRLLRVAGLADRDPWRARLRAHLLEGEADDELRALAASADLSALPVPSILLLGHLLALEVDRDAEVELLRRARMHRRDDFRLEFRLGEGLQRLSDPPWDEARRQYEIAVALRPHSVEARHRLARALDESGRRDEAAREIELLLEREPDDGHWHFHLAQLDAARGRTDEAIVGYRRAIELDPSDVMAAANLGFHLFERGDLDEAISWLEETLRIGGDRFDTQFHLGLAHFRRGEPERAEECMERLCSLWPEDARAHSGLMSVRLRQGRLDAALAPARRAVERAPDAFDPRVNLAWLLLETGDEDAAVEHAREAIRIAPEEADGHGLLVNGHVRAERWPEAVAAARSLLRVASDVPKHRLVLASALRLAGELEEAAAQARVAIAEAPDRAAWHELGLVRLAQGRPEEAIAALRSAAAAAAGEDEDVDRPLALALCFDPAPTPDRLAEATRRVERALAADAADEETRVVEGLVLVRAGDPRAARERLASFERPGGKDVLRRVVLALAHARLGDRAAAEDALRDAIDAIDARDRRPSGLEAVLLAEARSAAD